MFNGIRNINLRVSSVPVNTWVRVRVSQVATIRSVQYPDRLGVSASGQYFLDVWDAKARPVYYTQFNGGHIATGFFGVPTRAFADTELRWSLLVSGEALHTIKAWDIVSNSCLCPLPGPNEHQTCISCAGPTARFGINSSSDGTVKVWDVCVGAGKNTQYSSEDGVKNTSTVTELICLVMGPEGGFVDFELSCTARASISACREFDISS